jgi:hypothetical protein
MHKGVEIKEWLKHIPLLEKHGLIAKTEKIIKQRPFWEVILVLAALSAIFIIVSLWIG